MKRRRFFRGMRGVMAPYLVTVQRVDIRDGRVVLTCIHPRTGQLWPNVAVLGQGGSETMAVSFGVKAPDKGQDGAIVPEIANCTQGWLDFTSDGSPVYIGAVPRRQPRLVTAVAAYSEAEPHPRTFTPADICIMNGAGAVVAQVIVSANGSLTLATDSELRLQVTAGHKVQVFEDGDSGEPVVKFSPTQEVLNDIIERVNKNTDQLGRMTDAAVAVATAAATAAAIAGQVVEAERQTDKANKMTAWAVEATLLASVGDEIASGTLMVPGGS